MAEHKHIDVCERTAAAAWGREIQYEDDAKKQDAKIMSWCCHQCLDTIRKHQFGYPIVGE